MSLKKNLVSNFLLTSTTIILPLITFPYTTRVLSNDSYGRVALVDAFTQYFTVFSLLGIPFYGIREIARLKNEPLKCSKLVLELVSLQFSLALLFSVLFIGLHFFVPALKPNLVLIKVGCLHLIFSAFLIEWFYQGIENFTYITTRSLLIKLVNVVCLLSFVRAGDDYVNYYLINILLTVTNASFNFLYFLKKYYRSFHGSFSIRVHLRPLLVLFSINLAISIYSVLDTIILGLFTDSFNVSLYAVPLKLVKMYWTVIAGVGVVVLPQIAHLFQRNDKEAIAVLLKKSSSLVFLLSLPFCFFCLFFPRDILFVLSGTKYLAAANVLRVLSVVPLIVGLSNVWGMQFLLPAGMEKKILHAAALGLAVSVLFNLLLVPFFRFVGAGIACIAAEAAVSITVFYAARRRVHLSVDTGLLKLLAATMCCCIPLYVLLQRHFSGLLLIGCSGAIYCTVFALLQWRVFKNAFIFSMMRFRKKAVPVAVAAR